MVYDADYYPFGGARPVVTALADRYKFIAHERDAESGLDYYKFRMLATQTGRWISPDPVMGSPTVPQSLGRYGYVSDNPVNATDPLGLFLRGGGNDFPPFGGGGIDFHPPFSPGGLCWPGWTPPDFPSIPLDGAGAGWDIRCFEPQPMLGPPDLFGFATREFTCTCYLDHRKPFVTRGEGCLWFCHPGDCTAGDFLGGFVKRKCPRGSPNYNLNCPEVVKVKFEVTLEFIAVPTELVDPPDKTFCDPKAK